MDAERSATEPRGTALRRAVWRVAGAAGLALAALVAARSLALLPAIIAGAAVAAAALWALRAAPAAEAEPAGPASGDPVTGPVATPVLDALAALTGALPEPAIVLDSNAVVVAVNAAALAIAPGLRRGEHALLTLRMPAVVEAVRRALATGEAQRAEFSERVPVDRWYAAHIQSAGMVAGYRRPLFLLALHDLTPIRRVEEMRADFIANASHELRTPLAALSGFIDTLQGPARNDVAARDRFLAIMKSQAERMARLIDDLLSLSRIERDVHIQPDEPVTLAPVLRQVVDGLQLLAQERHVAVELEAGEDVVVRGDRDELLRLFENLIENGLKYGASGKKVVITLARITNAAGGTEARVTVRDFGPGIAAEHLPRLTERFYRIDVGHSRAEGGTGLGLSLVKHIVNRHRGRLTIESASGQGAAFSVFLQIYE